MAARISVVVPVYNVASYLEACLESLARQSVSDLEVVMVNDGSTDASPEIAKRFAVRDPRFRLIHQENAGLGAARNTGIEHATGEFLIFADSDDVVPRDAYELLLGTLDSTGSDFACGNVWRLTSAGISRVGFLARAFERTRLQTHITRYPPLLADRMAWNKLFRRSFWDRHGFRFPVGVYYEDTPVTLPAHYLARSVDVLDRTVYLWRLREGGDLSITQRRTEMKTLRDRVAAVDFVSRFLEEQGLLVSKAFYERTVLGHDLRYFLEALPRAGEQYRRLFIDLANDFIARADKWALDQPFAIDRLKWELVRRRALPELLEVLRFEDEELSEVPPVRERRHWYADYPYRRDERLRLGKRVYRLDTELAPVFRLNSLRWDGDTLRIDGYAYITMIGAPEPDFQTVELVARRRAGRRRLRVHADTVYRPDVTASAAQQFASLDWSGFSATVEARDLIRAVGDAGTWELGVLIRAGGVVRTTWSVQPAPLHAAPLAETTLAGSRVSAGLSSEEKLTVQIEGPPPCVRSCAVEDRVLQLEGDAGSFARGARGLEVTRRTGGATLSYPVYVGRSGGSAGFLARVPLDDLLGAPADEEAREEMEPRENDDAGAAASADPDRGLWDVCLADGKRLVPIDLPTTVPESAWTIDGRELAVRRTRGGSLALLERSSRALLSDVRWSKDGSVLLAEFITGPAEYEVILRTRQYGDVHQGTVRHEAGTRAFTAELTPGAVTSVASTRPLPEGVWDILLAARGADPGTAEAPAIADELLERLPASTELGHKRFHLGVGERNTAVLAVERDLADGERGGFAQRTLRSSFYPRQRAQALRDTVVYESFDGREYSDSPRAIHEELVRREAPFEHLWVVQDAAFEVPASARPLRQGSREYYEALARARYVVANDCWPRWFVRRAGQTCLQTWHGGPLKQVGLTLADRPQAVRAYRRALSQRAENWQLVLSPAPFATPIMRSAFPACEILETGLPRTDLLLSPDRERIAEEVRRRLGISARRVVLYAPTYLDHLEHRSPERLTRLRGVPAYASGAGYRDSYRQPRLLDLASLHEALDDDDVILFRKHRRVLDRLSAGAAACARDVSDYPDVMELLLVADVLVTDYSSVVFDFASTGRPIVFFAPTLDEYRDDIRGFSIEFEAIAPGPVLGTTEELIDALRDPEAVRAAYRERYEAFVASYCALSDGRASERVVDRVFAPEVR